MMMGIRNAFNPFKSPNKINFETVQKAGDDGAYDYISELPKGVFDLILCSSAGNGGTAFLQVWYFGTGGSGAAWEGKFKNPKKQQIKIHIGKGAGQEAYFELGSVRMITLTGGANGSATSTVAGGEVTVNSKLEVIETRISGSKSSILGNGYVGNVSINSPCTIRPWGDCIAAGTGHTQHNGGFKLSYVG